MEGKTGQNNGEVKIDEYEHDSSDEEVRCLTLHVFSPEREHFTLIVLIQDSEFFFLVLRFVWGVT